MVYVLKLKEGLLDELSPRENTATNNQLGFLMEPVGGPFNLNFDHDHDSQSSQSMTSQERNMADVDEVLEVIT